jgi:hypothetical protein
MNSSKAFSPPKIQRHVSAPRFNQISSLEQLTFTLKLSIEKSKHVLERQQSITTLAQDVLEKDNTIMKSELKHLSQCLTKMLEMRTEEKIKEIIPPIYLNTSKIKNNDLEISTCRYKADTTKEEKLCEEFKCLRERISVVSNSEYLFNLKQKLQELSGSIKQLSKNKKEIEVRPSSRGMSKLLELKAHQKELIETKNDYLRVSQKYQNLTQKPTEYITKNSQLHNDKYKSLVEDCYALDIDPNFNKAHGPSPEVQANYDQCKLERDRIIASIKNLESKIKRISINSESAFKQLEMQRNMLQSTLNEREK